MIEYNFIKDFFYKKDYKRFIKLYEKYASQEKSGMDKKILYFYARALIKEGKNEEAIKVLHSIIKFLNPDNFIYFELGRLYRIENNLDQAEYYLKKAVEFENGSKPQATFELGKVYASKNDFYNAEKYYLLSIKADNKSNVHAYCELGILYFNKNRIKDAEYYLKECVKQENTHISYPLYCLARIYIQTNRKDKAIEILKKFSEFELNNFGQSFFELGKLYRDLEDYDKAEEYFNKALETKQGNEIFTKFELAKLYIMQLRNNEAEELLTYCNQKANYPSIWFETGKFYYLTCDYEKAKEYFQKSSESKDFIKDLSLIYLAKIAQKDDKTELRDQYISKVDEKSINFQTKYQLAKIYLDSGFYDKFEKLINELLYINPIDPLSNILLAKYYISNKKYEEALSLLLNLVNEKNTKKYKKIFLYIGKIYLILKDFSNAEIYLNKASELSNYKDPFVTFELGRLYIEQNNYEMAKKQFLSITENDSIQNSHAYYELGRIETKLKNYEQAKEYFLICVQMEKGQKSQTHFELAKVYEILECFKEAEYHYKKSIELDNDNSIYSYIYLGHTYFKQKKYKEALECFKEATKFEGFGHTELGKTYTILGDYEKAEEEFKIAFNSIENQRYRTYYEYGNYLLKVKKYEEAKKYFQIAIEMSNNEPRCHRGIAQAYEGLNDEENSIKHYKLCIELDYKKDFGFDI